MNHSTERIDVVPAEMKSSRPDLHQDKPDGRCKGDAGGDGGQRWDDQSERAEHFRATHGAYEAQRHDVDNSIRGRTWSLDQTTLIPPANR